MSGLLLPRAVPLQGRVAFHHVDIGEAFLDRPRLEASVGATPDSLRLQSLAKTKYTVEEVQRKEDHPSLSFVVEYTQDLMVYRLRHVLPVALAGSLAAAATLLGDPAHAAPLNGMLLAGLLGLGALGPPGGPTATVYLYATAGFIWLMTAAEMVYNRGQIAMMGKIDGSAVPLIWDNFLPLVQMASLCGWLGMSAAAGWSRWTVELGPPSLPARVQREAAYMEGMQSITDVLASLLHTHWRHERASSFGGVRVPRWKTIKEAEAKTWLAAMDETERKTLRGVLYWQTSSIAEADRKTELNNLQAISDESTNGVGNAMAHDAFQCSVPDTGAATFCNSSTLNLRGGSSGGKSPRGRSPERARGRAVTHKRRFHKQKQQSEAELEQWLADYVAGNPYAVADDEASVLPMTLVKRRVIPYKPCKSWHGVSW